LITVFAIVFVENLFVLLLILGIKSLINNLVFVLERCYVDKREICHTNKHVNYICNFDAARVSIRELLAGFVSKTTSYLMKSILNEKFISIWSLILMTISFVGAISSVCGATI